MTLAIANNQTNPKRRTTDRIVPNQALMPSVEHRWAKRKATWIPGKISIPGIDEAFSCVIGNTSATGALIDLSSAGDDVRALIGTAITEFTLKFASSVAPSSVPCRVVWFSKNLVGVRYAGPFRVEEIVRKRRAVPA